MLHSPCPDPAELLDDLPGIDLAGWARHLESCGDCRARLDQLAGGDTWQALARGLKREPPGPALGQVIADLCHDIDADDPAGEDEAAPFLTPCDEPGVLGRFGPYDVLDVLGRGGMGVVLKAFDADLDRVVAVKVLAPQLATSPSARRRFAREARAAAAIAHDHVVPIHSVATTGGLPYLVMPHLPGGSLQQRLDAGGPLPLEAVLRVGMQTAAALAAAHAKGLVHRDVKPANILLEDGLDRVRLSDFGLARALHDASTTQSGYLAGTPEYMAPEQARGEPVDHRADLFSLGSVLYAMCTGRPPFQADTTLGVLHRVCEAAPPPVRRFNPNIPPWMVKIMNRLLSKSPSRRFQSAAEVSRLLADHLARLGRPEPRRWVAAVAAVLLLTTFAVAATVLKVRTPDGTLVIEVSDPSVQVTVDGSEVTIGGDGFAKVTLKPGKYDVRATKDGKPIHQEVVSVRKDGKEVVKVTLEPEPRAAAAKEPAKDEIDKLRYELAEQRVLTERLVAQLRDAERKAKVALDQALQQARDAADKEASARALAERARADAERQYRQALQALEMAQLKLAQEDGTADIKALREWLMKVRPDGRGWEWEYLRRLTDNKGSLSLTHRAVVTSAAWSPDGKTAAVAYADGNVILWDVATGKKVQVVFGSEAGVYDVAFSPDGKLLATAERDRSVRIRDAATGKQVRAITGDDEFTSVRFGPDGRTLVVGGADGKVAAYESSTAKLLWRSAGHKTAVSSVAVSPDGKWVASGGFDRTVRLWDPRTGKGGPSVPDHDKQVVAVAFGPDGKRLASGDAAGKVAITRIPEGETLWGIDGKSAVTALAYSPDGLRLVVGTKDGQVKLWDTTNGRELLPLKEHKGGVTAAAFSPDGKRLLTGGMDRTVQIHDGTPEKE